jgi:hypothetical protein
VPPQLASVPVNTDAVSCTPIFEIRETQAANAAINTFGNTNFNTNHPAYQAQAPTNSTMRDTQYSQPTPGPPFHISNVNSINMNTRNASYMPPQVSAQAGLGSATNQDFTPAGFTFMDDTDMDLSGPNQDQPSPATISSQSRGGSTSHSSYSPGTNEHNLPYRASPKPGTNSLPLQPTNSFPPFRSTNMETSPNVRSTNLHSAPHISYPPTTNTTPRTVDTNVNGGMDMFSTTFSTTGNTGDEAFNHGFLMGNEWEFGQTGLTPPPMSDGSWNQMLESVTMGWDANGGGGPVNHGEGH